MKRYLTVNGYKAIGKVEEVEGGVNVVLRLPFIEKGTAERVLNELCKHVEVVSEREEKS